MKICHYFLPILLALMICGTSLAQSINPPPQPKTESKGKATTQNQEAAKVSTPINNIPSTPKGQQSGEKNQKDADIKSPDERIATFTGWLVFVACIQALIFIAQGIAMWIQAKHLRGTVEATEKAANVAELSARAVIRLEMPIIQASPPDVIITSELIEDDGPYGGSFNHAHPTKYSVVNRIYFKNYGRSPAFPESLSVGWMVTDDLPDQPIYIRSSTLSYDSVINPRKSIDPDKHYGIELTDREVEAAKRGDSWLWFYGCLFYRDFMNEKREYRFCWRFFNQTPHQTEPHFCFSSDGKIPREYTKNT